MSDEMKREWELLAWLDRLECRTWRASDKKAHEEIRNCIIQKKPEITHPWSLAVIAGIIKKFKGDEESLAKWIFEAIDIGREVQKPEIESDDSYVVKLKRYKTCAYCGSGLQKPEIDDTKKYAEDKYKAWVDGYWKVIKKKGAIGVFEYTKNYIAQIISDVKGRD